MSITSLPYSGQHVTILACGKFFIFDWYIEGEFVKNDETSNISHLPEHGMHETIAAMAKAYKEANEEECKDKILIIRVDPATGAGLFHIGAYTLTELFLHSEGTLPTGEPCVWIDPAQYKAWEEAEIRFIEISPAHDDTIQLVVVDYDYCL